jgi:hypothetical protein
MLIHSDKFCRANKTGIEISAQILRSIFAREMGLKGVQDQYIGAFCVRIPQVCWQT